MSVDIKDKDIIEAMTRIRDHGSLKHLNEIMKIETYIDERIPRLREGDEEKLTIKRSTVNELKKAIKDLEKEYYKLRDYMEGDRCIPSYLQDDPITKGLLDTETELLLKDAIRIADEINIFHHMMLYIVSGISKVRIVEDKES